MPSDKLADALAFGLTLLTALVFLGVLIYFRLGRIADRLDKLDSPANPTVHLEEISKATRDTADYLDEIKTMGLEVSTRRPKREMDDI